MSKIFVTGGLGAVGSFLVSELRKRGHEVWFCDLGHHHDPNYFRCDISHYRQLERVFENKRFDYVYNLAAEFGRWNGEDFYENLWMTNAVGMKNILRLQEKHGFRLIHTSSSEVYGDYDGVMSEDVMDNHEIRQMNDYAITKWVNEMQIMNSEKMHATESVRIRLFNTYGPGEKYSSYRSVICLFTYRALHDIPYTVYLDHHRTSTYITDMVATLSNIVDNFKPGEVYNIGGTDYHDIKTYSNLILKYLGKDDSLVTYKEGEQFTTKNKKVDVSKAIRDLAHSPKITIEKGIPLTIEWMKKEYSID
ncbi:NAD(P)-dependent oxidoreductase [Thermodesulfovibrionales bacterium]|nr:NAD(P)-dependent oxidoreductase [Thermodesulfovibrionales bacterium]MCL0082942.1 NAD(P)-dependent oxidoreductase [Thermodesulfovibrionales bacterium]